jgi:hypothetical protein
MQPSSYVHKRIEGVVTPFPDCPCPTAPSGTAPISGMCIQPSKGLSEENPALPVSATQKDRASSFLRLDRPSLNGSSVDAEVRNRTLIVGVLRAVPTLDTTPGRWGASAASRCRDERTYSNGTASEWLSTAHSQGLRERAFAEFPSPPPFRKLSRPHGFALRLRALVLFAWPDEDAESVQEVPERR